MSQLTPAYPEPDVCVFCGTRGRGTAEGKLTREHAYPQWVRRALDPQGEVEWHIGTTVQPDRRLFEVEIAAVCRTCNVEWLGRNFETPVSRWLSRSVLDLKRSIVLDLHQREVVGAWAVKTALLLELALRELRGESFVPARHFEWLRKTSTPPPGCAIWIFAVNLGSSIGPTWTMLAWTQAGTLAVPRPRRILIPGESPTEDVREGYFATFTFGHLGFQVLGWDLDEHGLGRRHLTLRPPAHVQHALKLVWPAQPRRPLRWPWTLSGARPDSTDAGIVAVSAEPESMELLASWPSGYADIEATIRSIPPSSSSS